MAERKILVELQLSDQNAVANLGKLEIETKAYQKELRLLNAEIVKNQGATKQQELRVGELNARIRANQTVVRELKNDLSGATAAGLRFRDKMAEASRAGLAGFGIQALGVVGVTTAVVELTKELFTLSSEIEKTDARNKAIAGDSLPQFEAAAEATANAIGLTRREYVSLAADQALRLKQLGLEGDLVTELSTQTVEFSEKLSDFSAGELTTEQAASLLNDALTGQTKGLKALGINVKASKDEIAAQAQELMRSKGLTEEQATAVATLQLAFDATTESMQAFGDETLSIDEAQDQANSRFAEAKELLAEQMAPAFLAVQQAAAGFFEIITDDAGEKNLARIEERILSLAGGMSDFDSRVQKALKQGGLGFLFDDVVESERIAQNALTNITSAIQRAGDDFQQLDRIRAAVQKRLDAAKLEGDSVGVAVAITQLEELGKAYLKASNEATNQAEASAKGAGKTAKEATTLASLREELKSLKDAREDLDVTDTEGLKTNAASIAALEKQIAAIEVSTKATQGKTKAVQELTAAQKAQNELDLAAASITISGKDVLNKPQQSQVIDPNNDPEVLNRQITNDLLNTKYQEDAKNYQNAQDAKEITAEQALTAATTLAGGLAQLFDQQSAEYKAFATIQALISTYLGASQALAANPLTPPFVKIAQAAAIIFAGLANVRQIQGFKEGGHTKRKASNNEEVGVVHANEWVAPAWQVQHPTYAPIIASLERARKNRGLRSDHSGFFTGGGVYTFAKGGGIISAPRTTSATIATADMNRLLSSIDFQPVVRVTDINRGQKTVRVTDRMSTL
jgi:hypothetical protein